jgi:predicted enzyme related to lactoylglutathione lyase
MGEAVMAGKQSSFVWYELMSSDVAAAKAFYTKVVGWKTQDMPMPGMTYTLLSAGDTQVGGMMTLPKDAADAGMRPCWTSYIEVDDVDGAAAKVRSLGGKIYATPTDIPNVGRFAVVADPQGRRWAPCSTVRRRTRTLRRDSGCITSMSAISTRQPNASPTAAERSRMVRSKCRVETGSSSPPTRKARHLRCIARRSSTQNRQF